jgi:hypothetical protein
LELYRQLGSSKEGSNPKISQKDRDKVVKLVQEIVGVLEEQRLISENEKSELITLINKDLEQPSLSIGSALVGFALKLTGHL